MSVIVDIRADVAIQRNRFFQDDKIRPRRSTTFDSGFDKRW
jgi:hypothetical protein